jgi:hypothetical protein
MELGTLAAISGIAGTAVSAVGALQQGRAQAAAAEQQARMAEFQRKQMEIKANEEFAASQRDAEQLARERDLGLSRMQARASASGAEATSADVQKLAEEMDRYGTFRQQMALYGGASRQQGLREQGVLTGMEAESLRRSAGTYRTAGVFDALGTGLSGISTMARYRAG